MVHSVTKVTLEVTIIVIIFTNSVIQMRYSVHNNFFFKILKIEFPKNDILFSKNTFFTENNS
jgi:hypothetical protein